MAKAGELIRYDPSGTFLGDRGILPEDLAALAPRLQRVRRQVLDGDLAESRSGLIPPDHQPLDAGFVDLPENTLDDYVSAAAESLLGRILATARRLRDQVDRVVILGIGGSFAAGRALMGACCEPYFNELTRAQRGCRPRIYFAGNNVDNDDAQGLLKLLVEGRSPKRLEDRWAILVISKSGETLEPAIAFRQYLAALRKFYGGDEGRVAELVVPVTGRSGRLHDLSAALGCRDEFRIPEAVGGRFSVFSAVGLLPAALLGLDVVRLLEGASAMNDHFRTAPPGDNAVLDFAAVGHLLEKQRQATVRVLQVWAKSLEAIGWWYDQLLAESLGKQECGATPVTAVNTRDLHARDQQHQQGRRDKLLTNVVVQCCRCDPWRVGFSDRNQDLLNELAEAALPEIMAAAVDGTQRAYREAGRPAATLHLPRVDEYTVGQLLQMLMLATVVEGRLLGINPYGQPGVERYKEHMRRILQARGPDAAGVETTS